jgi:hypothetical protein
MTGAKHEDPAPGGCVLWRVWHYLYTAIVERDGSALRNRGH